MVTLSFAVGAFNLAFVRLAVGFQVLIGSADEATAFPVWKSGFSSRFTIVWLVTIARLGC